MALDVIRSQLAAKHADHPQRAYTAQSALAAIDAGLAALAGLGDTFSLVEGSIAPPQEWPKMYYSDSEAPYEMVVNSAQDAALLPPGWRDRLRREKDEEHHHDDEEEAASPSPST